MFSLECDVFLSNALSFHIFIIWLIEFLPVNSHLNNTIQRFFDSFIAIILVLKEDRLNHEFTFELDERNHQQIYQLHLVHFHVDGLIEICEVKLGHS